MRNLEGRSPFTFHVYAKDAEPYHHKYRSMYVRKYVSKRVLHKLYESYNNDTYIVSFIQCATLYLQSLCTLFLYSTVNGATAL